MNRFTHASCIAVIAGPLGVLGSPDALAHPGHEQAIHATNNATASANDRAEQPVRDGDRARAPAPMEAVDLPAPAVSIAIEGDTRVIRSNGLPTHKTGVFPNKDNPNALRPQNHEFRLPLVPTLGEEPIVARPEFGVAINGVIFDAGTGEFWTPEQDRAFGGGSPWNYEALGGGVPLGLDQNNAHVQPTGKYHYHGVPTGLLESITDAGEPREMVHLGWAFDGFPIYAAWGYDDPADQGSGIRKLASGYRLKSGERPQPPEGPGGAYDGTYGLDYEYVEGAGDLDECNGRFGVTPEFPRGTYYYVISDEFPQVPRLWRGVPDASFQRRGPGGPQGDGDDRGRPNRPGAQRPRRGPPRPRD